MFETLWTENIFEHEKKENKFHSFLFSFLLHLISFVDAIGKCACIPFKHFCFLF